MAWVKRQHRMSCSDLQDPDIKTNGGPRGSKLRMARRASRFLHSHVLLHIVLLHIVFRRPGGLSEEPEPDPIPNSAVKLLSADGTKSQDLEE